MNEFGSYLKESREKKGIRLEEIASITKIHLHNLQLMEAGKWEQLPPEPFIRGFVVAYAKYIGLDVKEAIQRFTEEQVAEENLRSPESVTTAQVNSVPVPHHPEPIAAPVSKRQVDSVLAQAAPLPIGKWATAAALIAVMGVGFWLAQIGKKTLQSPVVAVDAPTKNVDSPSAPVQPADAVAAATAPATAETVADQLARVGMAGSDEGRKPAAEAKLPESNPSPVSATASAASAVMPPATAPQTIPANSLSSTPPATATGHEITVEGKERSWIKVVVDDAAPTESFLPEGGRATYRAKDKIKVVLGNATGTRVLHNGEENAGKKFSGTIRSYIFPPNARFPQDVKPKVETTAQEPTTIN